IFASAIAAHLDDPVARTGDGAAHEQQVLIGVDADDGQALLGDALVAHLARSANPLHHARGPRGGADRTRGADVVRAVGLAARLEVVALDRALEALALRGPRDLDRLTDLERLDRHRLADLQLAGLVAELLDDAVGTGVGLLEVAELGLGQVLLLGLAEREL